MSFSLHLTNQSLVIPQNVNSYCNLPGKSKELFEHVTRHDLQRFEVAFTITVMVSSVLFVAVEELAELAGQTSDSISAHQFLNWALSNKE